MNSSPSLLRRLTRPLVRSHEDDPAPSKQVAIIVPFSTRSDLTPDEAISMRHLRRHLEHYDKYIVAPRGLQVDQAGFRVHALSRKFFGSAAAHARMLYDPAFYAAFADYKYIFFYHLDSLAFSDQLQQWCDTNVDYIGAPWICCSDTPWVKKPRVGNCGFALLKVSSALKVLQRRHLLHPATYWFDMFTRNGRLLHPLVSLFRVLHRWFPRWKLVSTAVRESTAMDDPGPHGRNTDTFWSDHAIRYWPEFKVASLDDGLRFAFEAAPRTCYEMNGNNLPFGCHAWARYDRKFWEPFLLPESFDPDSAGHGQVESDRLSARKSLGEAARPGSGPA